MQSPLSAAVTSIINKIHLLYLCFLYVQREEAVAAAARNKRLGQQTHLNLNHFDDDDDENERK